MLETTTSVDAQVDSGASNLFIDETFASTLQCIARIKTKIIPILVIDGS